VHSVRRAPKPEADDPRFRDVEPEGEEGGADAPAKKRRRRRRKPSGDAGAAPAAE